MVSEQVEQTRTPKNHKWKREKNCLKRKVDSRQAENERTGQKKITRTQRHGNKINRFAVFIGAGGVFCLVVWPWESWEIFVMDGEVLRLFTGRLCYHAN